MLHQLINTLPTLMIILGGLAFTLSLRGFFILHPVDFIKDILGGGGSLKSLNLALAGTLGVGNIVGVVNAIKHGGPGAVLWMLLSCILAASLKYKEAYRALTLKRDGKGGAYFYIEKAFSRIGRPLAVIFSVAFIVNTFATGCIMQSGAAVSGAYSLTGLNPAFISAFLAIIVFFSCRRGIPRVSKITNLTVPVMSTVYILLAFTVIVINRERLPEAALSIVRGAFNIRGMLSGVGSAAFTECIRYGVMRGLLSNEAGAGSSATAHATDPDSTPHRQGSVAVLEVLIDTAVMCSITALAILTSGIPISGENDIEIALSAFRISGGPIFCAVASLSVFVFGFATVICFSSYGGECISYIAGGRQSSERIFFVYLLLYTAAVALSPFVPGESFLLLADASMGIMVLINVPALFLLERIEKN